MPKLKPVSWKEFEKFLKFIGCVFLREKGDHRVWGRTGLKRPVVIPKVKSIPIFVIRNNLRILNIQVSEYLEILDKWLYLPVGEGGGEDGVGAGGFQGFGHFA